MGKLLELAWYCGPQSLVQSHTGLGFAFSSTFSRCTILAKLHNFLDCQLHHLRTTSTLQGVLVSEGCCNKLPETQYQGVHIAILSEGSREETVPCFSLKCWYCQKSLVFPGLQMHHSALCVCCYNVSLCVCPFSSYKATGYIGLGSTLIQYDLIFFY